MDLDTGKKPADMGDQSGQYRDMPIPENMVYPVDEYRVKTRICEDYFESVPRRRVSLENSLLIAFYCPPKAHSYWILYIKYL